MHYTTSFLMSAIFAFTFFSNAQSRNLASVLSSEVAMSVIGGQCSQQVGDSKTEYCECAPDPEVCVSYNGSCLRVLKTSKNRCYTSATPDGNHNFDCVLETTGIDCGKRFLGEKVEGVCSCASEGNTCGGDKMKFTVKECDVEDPT